MSSSVDGITCPACGGSGFREQYTTGFVEMHCTECDWSWDSELKGNKKTTISWNWEDVQSLQPDWSQNKCQMALDRCSKILIDRSVEEGWLILETLLDCNSEEIEAFNE